jgi:hypothetical protein
MSDQSCCAKARCAATAAAILGSLLIVGWLVWLMNVKTAPAPLGQQRAEERRKNLAEAQAVNHDALSTYGWQDPGKGIVRLPIERAMALTLQEWQNPAAARSNLLTRLDKATAVPPKAPPKPSEFE